MSRRQWIVFKLKDKELCRCTVNGTFESEIQNTKGLLAFENNCREDIEVFIV